MVFTHWKLLPGISVQAHNNAEKSTKFRGRRGQVGAGTAFWSPWWGQVGPGTAFWSPRWGQVGLGTTFWPNLGLKLALDRRLGAKKSL